MCGVAKVADRDREMSRWRSRPKIGGGLGVYVSGGSREERERVGGKGAHEARVEERNGWKLGFFLVFTLLSLFFSNLFNTCKENKIK